MAAMDIALVGSIFTRLWLVNVLLPYSCNIQPYSTLTWARIYTYYTAKTEGLF